MVTGMERLPLVMVMVPQHILSANAHSLSVTPLTKLVLLSSCQQVPLVALPVFVSTLIPSVLKEEAECCVETVLKSMSSHLLLLLVSLRVHVDCGSHFSSCCLVQSFK